MNSLRVRPRKPKQKIENLPLTEKTEAEIATLCQSLLHKIDRQERTEKYAKVALVLKLVGAGAFIAASLAFPTLPMVLKPFLNTHHNDDDPTWKRFNLSYLKRTLARLEQAKLVQISKEGDADVITLTQNGKRRVLKYALDEITIEKPARWDETWCLVSYDIPRALDHLRTYFREYLRVWRFYPLHESMYLHAYPCVKELIFLREYLGIGKYVRIFRVAAIENDQSFRDFFDV
ncbi:MAG: hypothetical protein AAB557_02485 [Patescibacteria group bacterium]